MAYISLYILVHILTTVTALPSPDAVSPTKDDIIKNKYIITMKPDIGPPKFDRHIEWVNMIHMDSLARRDGAEGGVERIWSRTLKAYSGEFDKSTMAIINKSREVLSIEPVRIIKLSGTKSIQANAPWGLASISHRMPRKTEYLYKEPIRNDTWAYILDTGVDTSNPEFEGRAFPGYNSISNASITDVNGHGTHCAGIIASKTYGVAKRANIMAVKVFNNSSTTTDVVLDGLAWTISNITNTEGRAGNSIISMSFCGIKSMALNDAIDKAYNAGILVVVSAGNNALDAGLYSPASASTALTVGAIDINNVRAPFSNYGKDVDLFAPGVAIPSVKANSGIASLMSGTSMASPHVAGIALYLMDKEKLSHPIAIKKRIRTLATKNMVLNPGSGSPNLLAYNGGA